MNDLQRRKAQERLRSVVIFLLQNCQSMTKTKLLKLLWLVDYNHVLETGLTITGESYLVEQHGPVPEAVFRNWPRSIQPFAKSRTEPAYADSYPAEYVELVEGAQFSDSLFSDFQMELLESIVERYGSMTSTVLEMITHYGDDYQNNPVETPWARAGGLAKQYSRRITPSDMLKGSEYEKHILGILYGSDDEL
ncbi:MAG: hypothetical protein BGO89_08590 [Candidatus Kapaibacterium thiocyanatum]|uniref:Antitoxin SocA-like Panacea domain-containing protein n=1 Tax=Candidatus Kapaibacterium thiocyanatum TaxID=1895771 RepID=A0A1M3KW17_9BACT|nr:MAG: hypothetical protein BGO89_08590 ['Candidatus Kapabacteria' thiocyanatum]